jgi:hypothetical protein
MRQVLLALWLFPANHTNCRHIVEEDVLAREKEDDGGVLDEQVQDDDPAIHRGEVQRGAPVTGGGGYVYQRET